MRAPARAAGLDALHGFLERGFDTFAALREPQTFLDTLATRERARWPRCCSHGRRRRPRCCRHDTGRARRCCASAQGAGWSTMCTWATAVRWRLSAPGSVAVLAGQTMLSQWL